MTDGNQPGDVIVPSNIALSNQHETASTSAAAQAQAAVQARYVVAQQRPRDWDTVRSKMLKDCKRTSFAKTARYHRPIGKGVEGPSIRFAESAMRAMGNVMVETPTIYDDADIRIVRVQAMDLESNTTYSQDVTVTKTVERKKPPKGTRIISQRHNSYGELTYTIPATDDDILNKQNALISKAVRTVGLRLVPGDLLDECMTVVKAVALANLNEDPDAERKRIVDAFGTVSVTPEDLKRYLGADLAKATPAQLEELRGMYLALADGEITWADVLDASKEDRESDGVDKKEQLKKQLEDHLEKRQEKKRLAELEKETADVSK